MTLKQAIRRAVPWLAIRLKWLRDRRALPLTAAHFARYAAIHEHAWWADYRFRFPNLRAPASRNDVIQWLKLFDNHPLSAVCCDKLAARTLIAERIGAAYLPAIHQVAERVDQLVPEALPRAGVLKANHDCGTVVPFRDLTAVDWATKAAWVARRLARVYGGKSGEWAYAHVAPRVFVEEHLAPDEDRLPTEYKCHVSMGRIDWVSVFTNRTLGGRRTAEVIHVSRDGVPLARAEVTHGQRLVETFDRPAEWETMMALAERLAEGFQLIRVDLYNIRGRIVAGELCLWPDAGVSTGAAFAAPGTAPAIDRTLVRPVHAMP